MNDTSSNAVPTIMPSSSQAQAQAQPEQYQPTSPPPQQPPPPIPTAQVTPSHPATTTMGVSNPHSQFIMPTSNGNIDPRYNHTGSMTSPSYQHQQQQQNQPQYQQPQQMQQQPYGNFNPAQPWQQPPPNVATNSYGYPQQQQQQVQQQPYPSSTYPPMQQAYHQQSNQQQQQQYGSYQPNPMAYPQPQPPYFTGNMNGVQYNTPPPQQQQQQVPQQLPSSATASSPGMSNWNPNSMNPSGMNAFVGTNSSSMYQSNTNQNAVGRYSTASSTASASPYSNHIQYNNNHSSTASVSTTGSISTITKTGMRRPPYVDPNTNIVYDVNDPDYEGWLYKQSQWLKEWRKRYFILKGSNLFFCKHPTSGAPHGMMDLSICTTVKSADDKSGKFHSFEISTPDTCYLLHAETESEKDDWIGRVGKAIVRCSRTYYKGDGSNNKNANTTRNYPNNSNNNRQENEDDDDDDIYENDDPDSPYFND